MAEEREPPSRSIALRAGTDERREMQNGRGRRVRGERQSDRLTPDCPLRSLPLRGSIPLRRSFRRKKTAEGAKSAEAAEVLVGQAIDGHPSEC